MKEEILSNCVKNFILKAISQNTRLDGRGKDEFRDVKINFGKEWGCCKVSMGETMVLAQVSCDVQQPKATRPNEGLLHINVDLSPMAAAHFESGTQSDLGVHLNRFLEKCFKESRSVDLESLCIVAEEKVWNLRVDLNVLNSDGNLAGCCSIAALAALMHFRRPDVTTAGEQVIIHTLEEKDPIPLSILHLPVAVSYAVFNKDQVIVDPTNLEERVAQTEMILGINTYRELCALHLAGIAVADKELLLRTSQRASQSALMLVNKIKEALADDSKARSSGHVTGLVDCISAEQILLSSEDRSSLKLRIPEREPPRVKKRTKQESESEASIIDEETEKDEIEVVHIDNNTAELKIVDKMKKLNSWEPSGGDSQWVDLVSSSSDEGENAEKDEDRDNDDDVELVKEITIHDRVVDHIELSGDSEEEETVTMKPEDLQ